MKEMFRRVPCNTEAVWLMERLKRLQASDAAVILGCSPWSNPAQLFDIKTGRVKAKDLSDKPYIQYGKAMEPVIREAVMLDLPYFLLEYDARGILESVERPWQGCTLDGELTVDKADNPWGFPTGTEGVLEIKTGSFRRESDLEEWERGIPNHYYCQVIHQLAVTGYEFAIVAGRLKREAYKDEDLGFPEVRNYYRIVDTRSPGVKEDIKALNEAEAEFWNRLKENRRPAVTLAMEERKWKRS